MYYKTHTVPLDQLNVGDTIVRVTECGADVYEGTTHLLRVATFEVDHRPVTVLAVTAGEITCARPDVTEVTVLRVLTHEEYRSELEKMTR